MLALVTEYWQLIFKENGPRTITQNMLKNELESAKPHLH